ncbi:HAD-IIIC family phosphatase [[Ruminococcus] gnavus]|uniref:HAD-IIIC family phosphatase n=1 Tax=Mediterraneibacter gnavus TaxID=33038 RepID=UPI00232C3166|nr:HAD-IIIC family phosphatase [Mediterraneibacter gnavus]MDB8703401.1 HAD-IIIC family phosphatase [Mediterraneibacter gnavus]
MNFNPEKIKVIIWDLDETFWSGTISEETISIPEENIKLIKTLTSLGIVNSICAKNDMEIVKKQLQEVGVWEYFVFPSVNWEPKGKRIQQLISNMNLRAANALFIDDNVSNLNEANYFCNDLMISTPEFIPELIQWANGKDEKDPEHLRLKRYKVLEQKKNIREQSESNQAFLEQSNIQIVIESKCDKEVERIHELISRTNQLNYTKKRISIEELENIIKQEEYDCGYISVKDKYGDYGIVGFYALRNLELEHFLFSCRTLGMGIEQYVYAYLKFPKLDVEGEVATKLDKSMPKWIHKVDSFEEEQQSENDESQYKILMKGPCDMMQLFTFIKDNDSKIDWEFTYVGNKGNSIEQHNHTECIREAFSISQQQIDMLVKELPFADSNMFSKRIYSSKYDIVFLSLLTDGGLGMYRRKNTGEIIAFGQYYYPLTEERYWSGFISGEIPAAEVKFTKEMLQDFSEQYEFVGRISADRVVDNIKFIREKLPKETLLVLMLGVEIPFENNKLAAYNDRHDFHKELNGKIRNMVENTRGIRLIEFGNYVKKQSDFYNNINHFIKPIYYHIASEMIQIIKEYTSINLKNDNLLRSYLSFIRQVVRKILKLDKFNR